jgi:hypothetical protein
MLKGPASLPYQYLLLETRDPSGRWDKGLNYSGISKPGVLIEHVDETVGSGSLALGNDINCHSAVKHQGVMPIYPYEDTRLKNAGGARQQSLWYQDNASADVTAGIGPAASADYLKANFFAAADSVSADVSTDITVRNFSAPDTARKPICRLCKLCASAGSSIRVIRGPTDREHSSNSQFQCSSQAFRLSYAVIAIAFNILQDLKDTFKRFSILFRPIFKIFPSIVCPRFSHLTAPRVSYRR